MKSVTESRIGVIGLGYVGLPLAVAFGRKLPTVGFDINAARVEELKSGRDSTLECDADELAEATHLAYSSDSEALAGCNVLIATVPTPIDSHNRPMVSLALTSGVRSGRLCASIGVGTVAISTSQSASAAGSAL